MDGCIGGRWVMGTPFTQNASIALPPTITFGAYESKLYETITPVKVEIDAMVTTAAEVLHLCPLLLTAGSLCMTERCLTAVCDAREARPPDRISGRVQQRRSGLVQRRV